jgi:hypothetical protein
MDNVTISDVPSDDIKAYIYRVCKNLGIETYAGFVDIEFLKDAGFGGTAYCDGDEDLTNITIGQYFEGLPLETNQIMINVAHELVHAQQMLSGRLLNSGFQIDKESPSGLKNVYKFENRDYVNIPYMEQPWEIEAYGLEKIIFEECK